MTTVTQTTQEAFTPIAQAVAWELGPEWTLLPDPAVQWAPSATIVRDDKAALMLIVNGDRVEISGKYGYGMSITSGYGMSITMLVNKITVAVKRGPAVIARDITNRLLHDYLASYAQAVEQKRTSDAAQASRQSTMKSLAAIVKEPLHNEGIYMYVSWIDESKPLGWEKASMSVDASMIGTTSANIAVRNAPVALVARLLQVIQEFREAPKEKQA